MQHCEIIHESVQYAYFALTLSKVGAIGIERCIWQSHSASLYWGKHKEWNYLLRLRVIMDGTEQKKKRKKIRKIPPDARIIWSFAFHSIRNLERISYLTIGMSSSENHFEEGEIRDYTLPETCHFPPPWENSSLIDYWTWTCNLTYKKVVYSVHINTLHSWVPLMILVLLKIDCYFLTPKFQWKLRSKMTSHLISSQNNYDRHVGAAKAAVKSQVFRFSQLNHFTWRKYRAFLRILLWDHFHTKYLIDRKTLKSEELVPQNSFFFKTEDFTWYLNCLGT